MDESDFENQEDLNELEARLYAQVHHEAPALTNMSEPLAPPIQSEPQRIVTQTSINYKSSDKSKSRYWSQQTPSLLRNFQHTNQQRHITGNLVLNPLSIINRSKEVDEGVFPTPSLSSNLVASNEMRVNPFASGKDPKPQGSNITEVVASTSTCGIEPLAPPPSKKLIKNNDGKSGAGAPFSRQLAKLDKRKRLAIKKKRRDHFKQLKRLEKLAKLEAEDEKNAPIVLDSDSDIEGGNDDVVEVPVPSPPCFLIDDSSCSEDEKKGSEKMKEPQPSSSRCTSPTNSVISSDDFIGQTDRSRLLNENNSIVAADDEDLVCLQESVGSFQEASGVEPFVHPNTEKLKPTSYQVTQSNFKAVDIYDESESDIQESIYKKGTPTETVVENIVLESNDSSIEEIPVEENVRKTKRLRKRQTSSSNKGSEPNNSTDEDDETLTENTDAQIAYISRGEAVESCKDSKTRHRRRSKSSNVSGGDINLSDNEFLNKLNSMAKGKNLDDEEDESGDDKITARKIAEDVLSKTNKKKTLKVPIVEVIDDAMAFEDPPKPPKIVQKSKEIKSFTQTDINNLFDKIDTIEDDQPNFDIGRPPSPYLKKSGTPPPPRFFGIDNDSEEPILVADSEAVDFDDFDKILNKRLGNKNSKLVRNKESVDNNIIISDNADESNNIKEETEQRVNSRGDFSNNKLFYSGYYESENGSEGIGWNVEMSKFYTNSWNGEDFTVEGTRDSMDPSASWKIHYQDMYPKPKKYCNVKCLNCCEFGHLRSKCSRPKKPLVCYMCGETGHSESRCPNTLCMRCGNKTRVFTKSCNACTYQNRQICPICKIRGHSVDSCPDLWRRYHSTTLANTYPNNDVQYNRKKFCCICAQKGHLYDRCRFALRHLEYPNTVIEIKSFQKSYDDLPVKDTLNAYNLHYNPNFNVSFNLAENSEANSYYTRFLKATGLSYLINRKRKIVDQKEESVKTKTSKKSRVLEEKIDETKFKKVDNAKNIEVDNFKKPDSSTTLPTKAPESHNADEDSNYSFSEHFDTPISETEVTESSTSSKQIEFQPDFIPLGNDEDIVTDDEFDDADINSLISNPYVEGTDDEDDKTEAKLVKSDNTSLPSVPCEAKIYLSNFHSRYLLSPDGHNFLVENAKKFDVKARLAFSSLGYILVLFGRQEDQDKFHTDLLLMFRSLSTRLNRRKRDNSTRMPKKTTAIVRLLRDNLGALQTNLGNVNDLYKRLQVYSSHDSLKGWKISEKIRRTLNMIFMGQALLGNGKSHFDKLLISLKTLLNEFKDIDIVSNELRDEIHFSWKYIFSSEPQDNYEELVSMYNDKKRNNQLLPIELDPYLMGRNVVDVSFSKEQKDILENPPTLVLDVADSNADNENTEDTNESRTIERKNDSPICNIPPLIPKNQNWVQGNSKNVSSINNIRNNSPRFQTNTQRFPKQNNQQKFRNNARQNYQKNSQQYQGNMQQYQGNGQQFQGNAQQYQGNIQSNPQRGNPSPVWSRECMRFLNECMVIGRSNRNNEFIEKLTRIQDKANRGVLSFNDYRAVIQIHNAVKIAKR